MNTEHNHEHDHANVCTDWMGSCGCGCGSHGNLLKWALMIAVGVLIFCLAYKMGELKGMLRSAGFYGNGGHKVMMYRGYGSDNMMNFNGEVGATMPMEGVAQ